MKIKKWATDEFEYVEVDGKVYVNVSDIEKILEIIKATLKEAK